MSASRSVFSTLRLWVYDARERLLGCQFVSAPRMVVARAGRALTRIVRLLMMDDMISGVLEKESRISKTLRLQLRPTHVEL